MIIVEQPLATQGLLTEAVDWTRLSRYFCNVLFTMQTLKSQDLICLALVFSLFIICRYLFNPVIIFIYFLRPERFGVSRMRDFSTWLNFVLIFLCPVANPELACYPVLGHKNNQSPSRLWNRMVDRWWTDGSLYITF